MQQYTIYIKSLKVIKCQDLIYILFTNRSLCYSPSGLHWNTLGRLLRSRYVSRHYNPHSAFKFVLHHWLSFVAKALNLDDFLLPINEDANGNASTSRIDEVKESQDDQVDSKYVFFKFIYMFITCMTSEVCAFGAKENAVHMHNAYQPQDMSWSPYKVL